MVTTALKANKLLEVKWENASASLLALIHSGGKLRIPKFNLVRSSMH